jgi:hypothetical protein
MSPMHWPEYLLKSGAFQESLNHVERAQLTAMLLLRNGPGKR